MGAFISRQPNGKLARFSSVVDAVTDYNMTDDDYIKMCMDRAAEEAKFYLEHHVQSWDYMLKNVNGECCHMTEEEKKKFLEETSGTE